VRRDPEKEQEPGPESGPETEREQERVVGSNNPGRWAVLYMRGR
jgi:hypothetical protein